MDSIPAMISRLGKITGHVEKGLLVALTGFLVGFALLQIVLRNFFSTGLVWGDTLLRHVVLWIGLLGASRATAENGHIRIDLLTRMLPEAGTRGVELVGNTLSLAVCAALFYASWNFVLTEYESRAVAFASVPYWPLETAFPLCFGLMTIRYAALVAGGVYRPRRGGPS